MNDMESTVVVGLQAGNPEAFEELVRTSSGRLLATAYRILGSEDAAQDAVQEGLIAAWKAIASFEGESSLSTWLHRIVVNASLARLRSAKGRGEVSLSDETGTVASAFEGLAGAWTEPGPRLETKLAMRTAIQKALRLIPEEFRTVLVLRDVEELSSREVAERLGIPDATVRQRLHRARAAMAEILRPELCGGAELTCGGQLDLLLDYIDAALPAELQVPVHEHLESCETCGSLLEIYRTTVGIPRAVAEWTTFDDVPEAWISRTAALGNAGGEVG
jgi:RNA polymerase sigma-70 factor (ECF subfamily)